jgi:hypothetical protein
LHLLLTIGNTDHIFYDTLQKPKVGAIRLTPYDFFPKTKFNFRDARCAKKGCFGRDSGHAESQQRDQDRAYK